jgi:hypothetical protein
VVATVEAVTGPDLGAYMAAFGDLEGAALHVSGWSVVFGRTEAKSISKRCEGTIPGSASRAGRHEEQHGQHGRAREG